VDDQFIIDIKPNSSKESMPDLKILSYDIETSKDPLKFPDAEKDQVMMVSLMYEGEAFLIINCGFCGHEVEEFYYSPQEEFSCHVTVFNEPSEK
jgi:DNA polymerase epsilon subunit 1